METNAIEKRVVSFIKKHHVLTLATSTMNADGVAEAYCSNMFYTYMSEDNLFVFTSADQTRHVSDALQNGLVAGSIVLESKVIGNLQGLQFQGKMYQPTGEKESMAKMAYLKKFPYAAVMPLTLWVIEPTFMKLTDNRLGFGKKIIWTK